MKHFSSVRSGLAIFAATAIGFAIGNGSLVEDATAQSAKTRGDCVLATTTRSTYDFKKEINARYAEGYDVKAVAVPYAGDSLLFMAVMCK